MDPIAISCHACYSIFEYIMEEEVVEVLEATVVGVGGIGLMLLQERNMYRGSFH